MSDAELDELERLEALVRGPGWVPDIDKGPNYEEWTGKWYTPPRPDGTGGCSLALYADDEEILYAKYIAALRNAAPRLVRTARRLAVFDHNGIVAENEALRQRLCEVERERDEQQQRAKDQEATVAEAFALADKYTTAKRDLRRLLGARWGESLEQAAERLASAPPLNIVDAAREYSRRWEQRELAIASAPEGPRGEWDDATKARINSMTAVWMRAHAELLRSCGTNPPETTGDEGPPAPDCTPPE